MTPFIPLAMALVDHVAVESGVRCLFIKGAVANLQAVRPSRAFGDVDVLVDPRRFDSLVESLFALGWHPRPVSGLERELVSHSQNLIHPSWPCDLDLHHMFPGFLADPADVFDVLWRRSERMAVASRELPISDFSSTVLIAALHSLRTYRESARMGEEWAYLLDAVVPRLGDEDRHDILRLAHQTGALESARLLLERVGSVSDLDPVDSQQAALLEWNVRVASGGDRTAQVILRLRRAAPAQRASVAWAALWPSPTEFAIDHPETHSLTGRYLRARVARIARGAMALPRVVRSLWSARHDHPNRRHIYRPGDGGR